MIEIEKETIRVGVKVKCGGSHVRFDKVPKVVGLDLGWLSMRDSSRHVSVLSALLLRVLLDGDLSVALTATVWCPVIAHTHQQDRTGLPSFPCIFDSLV